MTDHAETTIQRILTGDAFRRAAPELRPDGGARQRPDQRSGVLFRAGTGLRVARACGKQNPAQSQGGKSDG